MLDFIRKPELWALWDQKLDRQIPSTGSVHLKSIQDLFVYSAIKDLRGKKIAEIGGGDSRILHRLSAKNECYNIERFEGKDGGPEAEISIDNVRNIKVFLGEFSAHIDDSFFDVVSSVSVIEHVPNEELGNFFNDGMRILKPGGIWVHAIDFYLEDKSNEPTEVRLQAYREWLADTRLEPSGKIYEGSAVFSCSMATNPDRTMFNWGSVSPALINKRQRAQSVSLFMLARRN